MPTGASGEGNEYESKGAGEVGETGESGRGHEASGNVYGESVENGDVGEMGERGRG